MCCQLVFASQEVGLGDLSPPQSPAGKKSKGESTSAAGAHGGDVHAEVGFVVNHTNSFDTALISARSDSLL